MHGTSALLTHVSEISFPIQQRVELGRLGELDLADPAGALGDFIGKFGLAGQRLVYTKDFAAYRRIEVACGLDRLDNAGCAALLPPYCAHSPTGTTSCLLRVTPLTFAVSRQSCRRQPRESGRSRRTPCRRRGRRSRGRSPPVRRRAPAARSIPGLPSPPAFR